jgi:hypothetical protein
MARRAQPLSNRYRRFCLNRFTDSPRGVFPLCRTQHKRRSITALAFAQNAPARHHPLQEPQGDAAVFPVTRVRARVLGGRTLSTGAAANNRLWGDAWLSYKREFPLAAEQLRPFLIRGGQEPAIFSKIFKRAPVWLLEFTQVWIHAWLLNFKLRPLSHRGRAIRVIVA